MDMGVGVTWAATILGFCMQVTMLCLQMGALRRHGHDSFRMLVIASICGVAYTCLVCVPLMVTLSSGMSAVLYAAGLLLLLPAYILSVAGTVVLFRSYRRLAEQGTEAA